MKFSKIYHIKSVKGFRNWLKQGVEAGIDDYVIFTTNPKADWGVISRIDANAASDYLVQDEIFGIGDWAICIQQQVLIFRTNPMELIFEAGAKEDRQEWREQAAKESLSQYAWAELDKDESR